MLLADSTLFLGNDLVTYLVLAIGGALFVGNVMAVVRPPEQDARRAGDLERAPVARSLVMAAIGFVAAVWALLSLVAG